MRIGILWKNDYPWDVRVEKIARCLAEDGHEVFILCANVKGRSRAETMAGLHIRRLPATSSPLLNRIISIPFYLNPFWFRMANRVVVRERLELIIVRDLPLISVGLWLKRRRGIPLILDMAENYPAMYREGLHVGGLRGFVQWVMKNPRIMELMERKAIRAVDHTLVVVEESAQRIKKIGAPEERVSIVSNTPRVEVPVSIDPPGDQRSRSYLLLMYVGFVQDGRGLDVVIHALRALHDKGQDVRLRVVGDGDYMKRLVTLVREERLEHAVEFTGWVAHSEVTKHIQDGDIGVIPHPKNAHTDTTIPNKLFDYMAGAKPVIVSNAAPLERIVTEESCGLVFSAGSVDSLADVLMRMITDPRGRKSMGRNGAEAVQCRFNWDRDAVVLRNVVARVGSTRIG